MRVGKRVRQAEQTIDLRKRDTTSQRTRLGETEEHGLESLDGPYIIFMDWLVLDGLRGYHSHTSN